MDTRDSLYRTPPPQRSSTFMECPPAPCRRSLLHTDPSHKLNSSSDDDELEPGIRPIDASTASLICRSGGQRTVEAKRPRIEQHDSGQTSSDISTSKYSDLIYMEAEGAVVIHHEPLPSSPSSSSPRDQDTRHLKLLISYRTLKNDPEKIQIALIVYKSINTKPRRNLLTEFAEESDEEQETTMTFETQAAVPSQLNTVPHGRLAAQTKEKVVPASAPPSSRRAEKRPIMSRGCLRF
jgi:hypothetical protein